MRIKTVVLSILCLIAISLNAEKLVIRLPDATFASFEKERRSGSDIAAFHEGQYLDLVIPQSELNAYYSRFPHLEILQTEAEMAANLGQRDLPGYRSYAEIVDILEQTEIFYPHLAQIFNIGQSQGKEYYALGNQNYADYQHDIFAIRLSSQLLPLEDKPAFYFVGAHHAREPISAELCVGILQHLVENYGTDPAITEILDSSVVWILPLLNPDGHKIVIDQVNLWWRKNLRDNNINGIIDADAASTDGVDLNRNYGYHWGWVSATDNPFSDTFHGPEAFSEPETRAFRDFLASQQFLAGISYHSYGQYVLYPYGYMHSLQAPDVQEMSFLAGEMAANIVPPYTAMPSYNLYPVSGTSEDWAYSQHGIFAYTIELATQFIPPAVQVPTIVANNLPAALKLLDRKNYRCLTGQVKDLETGIALAAKIRITEIDEHSLERGDCLANPVSGRYWRFLPAGTFTAQYFAEGYHPQSVVVNITDDGICEQDVFLEPAQKLNQELTLLNLLGEPLSTATITLENGTSQVTDMQGRATFYNVYAGKHQLYIHWQGFSGSRLSVDFNGLNQELRLLANLIFTEDFEGGNLQQWQILSGNWGLTEGEAYQGNHSLTDSPNGNYTANQDVRIQMQNYLDLRGLQNISLQFACKQNLAEGDYAAFGYMEAGSNQIYPLVALMGESPWEIKRLDISHLVGKRVKFYFALRTDQYLNADGVYIDDIRVYANSHTVENQDLVAAVPQLKTGPNPFSDQLQIYHTDTKNPLTKLELYNLRGQKVSELENKSLTPTGAALIWNIEDAHRGRLPGGIYFLKASFADGRKLSKKILKL